MVEDMTLEEAVAEIGHDVTLTGEETPLADGEVRIEYTADHVIMDAPVLVKTAEGNYLTMPWTYKFGFSDD